MDLLIAGGTILDPETGGETRADVLVLGGVIAEVGDRVDAPEGVRVLDASGKLLSPGWIDMHVHAREPGQEHKETIETAARAAAFGGFTAIAAGRDARRRRVRPRAC